MSGKIYLIPTTLGSESWDEVLPSYVATIARDLDVFVVENVRSARRFLSSLKMPKPISELQFTELNEHTPQSDVEALLAPVLEGHNIGILSEAGVPAVADPGSNLVRLAHKKGITVVPLVGPSSIIMALMSSGLNGQNFAFVGYIPVKPNERKARLKQLEHRLKTEGQTQLFIEAPYRNNQLFADMVETLDSTTQITIAADITLESEFIKTATVREWKQKMPDLHKRPSIFGIGI
ncbi:MAG: SAM-dependent methyltransferase [Bacteroidales bacterium]|nr:SAM-dependent methyltransferase [Bacteroidales bacterium]MBN2748099.1 SAM-dependent methyltransferase [Bacteroidales bacterium]